jgi:hypothetical protein
MGDIKKNSGKNIGNELLELVNDDDSLDPKENQRTSLTVPEFEDQDVQRGWEKLASSPMETKISPLLGIHPGLGKSGHGTPSIAIDGGEEKNKPVSVADIEIVQALKANIVEQGQPDKDLNKIKPDRQPISSVETIAMTVVQKNEIVEAKRELFKVPSISAPPSVAPPPIQPKKGFKGLSAEPKLGNFNLKNASQKISGFGGTPEQGNSVIESRISSVEQIRIAQNRISQLEKEVETLKWDNEKLGYSAQLIQRKFDELNLQKQKIESNFGSSEMKLVEENKLLKTKLDRKCDEYREVKVKAVDLESRLAQDVRRSGGRERDLENRLELIRMEKISLVAGKDEIILNLKRQIDQLQFEIESYRKKTSELQKTIGLNEEQIRRTVRALRLALTNLEISEDLKISKQGD